MKFFRGALEEAGWGMDLNPHRQVNHVHAGGLMRKVDQGIFDGEDWAELQAGRTEGWWRAGAKIRTFVV